MSTPQQLREMLDVIDDDNLRNAFARPDAYERGDTREVVDAALYPWLLSHTRAEATAAAQAAGWPLAGVNTPDEVLSADHLHQRGFWFHTDDPVAGAVDVPGPPARYGEGGWALRRLAPDPGELQAGADAEWPPGHPRVGPLTGEAVSGRDEIAAVSAAAGAVPPLAGIRVLDLTTVWAGPYATMLLADLGAEVIRVENPFVLPPTTKGYQARPVISDLGALASGYGPIAPGRPDRPYNRHSMNNSLCRNKRACTIDTRQPEGRELLMRLAERCDVFIENFKASGLKNMGIQVSELQARNPSLIILRLPPTGMTGDWSSYTGFGAQFDGLSGMTWLCGHRGTDPMTSPATTYMDAASGPAAAFATFAALHYRAAKGRGQLIELAQMENVIQHLGDVFVDCQLGIKPERMGNRDRWRAPQGLYPCAGDQRWLAVSVADDDEWQAMAAAIGRPELASDPRFADVGSRQANHDDLDAIITQWTAGRDVLDAFHVLQGSGVTAGPLLDDDMFSNDPHIEARRWLRPLSSLDVGTHPHPSHPYRGVPQLWWRGSPALGQDNDYVYKGLLGVSDEDYARYAAARILAEDYLDPSGEPY
jgi:crotonobetainyl-CoA:carnitine CoA-transferase CaiB-like acyl-CoA transferase